MRTAINSLICSVALLVPCYLAADEPADAGPAGSKPAQTASAAEPVTLENVVRPEGNRADEPVATEFSAPRAAHFLDSVALDWQKNRKCMTCHTNYLYLLSRPALGADNEAHATVRKYAEDLVAKRWEDNGPRWDAEVVMTALVLAFNDRATTGKLHPLSQKALDRTWTVQKEDGGFEWLKCDWPPMESDDYFGATMAALAASLAPEHYAETPAAQAGLEKLRRFFASNPPPTLHHRAMILWADTYRPGFLTADQRKACLDELLALQHEDGGWGVATLGDWHRGDDSPQDLHASDGYGTGLVVYLARRADVPADDPRLVRGIAWLKTHQRQSGRWFTRSLYRDTTHYLSHAGTSLAILALSACDALSPVRTASK